MTSEQFNEVLRRASHQPPEEAAAALEKFADAIEKTAATPFLEPTLRQLGYNPDIMKEGTSFELAEVGRLYTEFPPLYPMMPFLTCETCSVISTATGDSRPRHTINAFTHLLHMERTHHWTPQQAAAWLRQVATIQRSQAGARKT